MNHEIICKYCGEVVSPSAITTHAENNNIVIEIECDKCNTDFSAMISIDEFTITGQ